MIPGGVGYSDTPCAPGFSSRLPFSLSALEMADMEAAFIGGLAKYCISVGSIPPIHLSAFWFSNGECKGMRGDRLPEVRRTVSHLIHYVPFIIGTEGIAPLLEIGEKIREVSEKTFPQECEKWLTEQQAAELTGRSVKTVNDWRRLGWVETIGGEQGFLYSLNGLKAVQRIKDEAGKKRMEKARQDRWNQ